MGTVKTQMAMSLDGFIAGPQDGIEELFGFYFDGEVPVKLSEGFPELRVSQRTAELLVESTDATGATVVGRRLYDITNGWGGHPGGEVPMVVLTHEPPTDWPRDGVPIHFANDVASAVTTAQELAAGKDVSVAGATAARECLDAGLLDEITVSLVPVVLGAGVPWFAGARSPVRLSDPQVVEDRGVTHLRYRVQR